MESASALGRNRSQGGSTAALAAIQARENDSWASLRKLIAVEYSYCTMHGVHVVNGCIVACEGIQRSFTFSAAGALTASLEDAGGDHWQALESLCAKLGSGRLDEVRFSQGKPASARTKEGGRRFKHLLSKAAEERQEHTPMS